MKKTLLVLCLAFSCVALNAQSTTEEREMGTTTKSGQKILPQAGDMAIGIDATGFLEYLGNSFNNTSDNSAKNIFSYDDNVFGANSIYGKYFLTDNTALRVKLHIGIDSYTDKQLVKDDKSSDPYATVEDSRKISNTGIGFRVGYEMRRGYGRLQGFYGAEVGFGVTSSGSETYKYGNDISVDDGGASYYDFNLDKEVFSDSRTLKRSHGSTVQGLVGGFAGVEYFIAPKLSVGGEFGLGLRFASQGKGKYETEFIETSASTGNQSVTTRETESGGSSSFEFKANYSAALTVAFHF